MPYATSITLAARMSPPAVTGAGTRQEYGPGDTLVTLTGTGDTIAQIILDPDTFTPGGSKPNIKLDLDTGTDPDIAVTMTAGGGGEQIAYTILQMVAGAANDFDLVRAIVIKAVPYDPLSASKLKAIALIGDTASDVWDRQIHQIGFDSTAAGQSVCGLNMAIIPQGHTHASAKTLEVKIYEALNARIIITLAGK